VPSDVDRLCACGPLEGNLEYCAVRIARCATPTLKFACAAPNRADSAGINTLSDKRTLKNRLLITVERIYRGTYCATESCDEGIRNRAHVFSSRNPKMLTVNSMNENICD